MYIKVNEKNCNACICMHQAHVLISNILTCSCFFLHTLCRKYLWQCFWLCLFVPFCAPSPPDEARLVQRAKSIPGLPELRKCTDTLVLLVNLHQTHRSDNIHQAPRALMCTQGGSKALDVYPRSKWRIQGPLCVPTAPRGNARALMCSHSPNGGSKDNNLYLRPQGQILGP